MQLRLILVVALGIVLGGSCVNRGAVPGPVPGTVPGTPPALRVAAEWEPAVGVLVRWPPYLPHRLFVELALDSRLFVLVEDEDVAADARRWFAAWGIADDRFEFVEVPGSDDAAWTRDYGPHPIFTAQGRLEFGDARYDKTTPDSALACDAKLLTPWNGGWGDRFRDYDITHEDAAPTRIARRLGATATAVPFVLTGGNFLTDGRGTAISTCILLNENRSNGLDDAAFRRLARDRLGIDRYLVLPNFEESGIQHIDCLLKLIDDETLLVARPPCDHAASVRCEMIVDEYLRSLVLPSGRPYRIERIDTPRYHGERLAAYTNSLILNRVVYVPLFGIAGDEAALATWHAVMPGHTVKGFPFVLQDEPAAPARVHRMYDHGIGWRNFDALHCRTRAVWDDKMLHIAVDRVPPDVPEGEQPLVTASVTSYSGSLLLAGAVVVCWRRTGDADWQSTRLERGLDGRFRAQLPRMPEGSTVHYYVAAADLSGRRSTAPVAAPEASYRYRVVGSLAVR